MIRVAFGSVPKDGGTFTFYRNLRPELLKHGVDLRCVTVGRAQADLTESAFVDEGCVQLAADSYDLKTQAQAFSQWAQANHIDIVIGVNSHPILSALPHLPERIRAVARCANGFDEGYRLTLVGRDRLARIVALVPKLERDLIAKYGVDPEKIVLIPNGAECARFARAADTVRGKDKAVSLGFLGRLEHRQKGVMHLPKILDALDRRGVEYTLSIAGKGKHESDLRTAFGERVADGRVRFVGTLRPDEIPQFLGATDIFLFPSHFEGCPNALLEAMMAGAVPVSWRLPGITDFLLDEDKTGFLAEVGDIEGFAAHIASLASDHGRLAEMARAVARAARERFSVEACTASYVRLFEDVMRAAPPSWSPLPWSDFRVDPLFQPPGFARLVPACQREALKSVISTLRRPAEAAPTVALPAPATVASCGDRLRVHQIVNSIKLERGGAERLARRLHEGLQKAGVDSTLLSLEACDTDGIDNAVTLGLDSSYDPRSFLRLADYAKRIRPEDVIHVHLFPAIAHVAALSHLGRLPNPKAFTEHSTSNRRRNHLLGGFIDKLVYRPFDQIVAISSGVEGDLLRARPWLLGHTCVIENGCPLPFEELPKRPLRPDIPRILSVGRLTPAKNYQLALEAVALLGPRDFRYIIAGDGPERPALERTIRRLGLQDRVELLGYVSDVGPLLREADILLMPSKWEGFGLAAVEGMNAGLPVVASDVPGLRDVVGTDGAAAALVDPSDASGVAETLTALLDDPERRREMGRVGAVRSRTYDISRYIDDHLEMYRRLQWRARDAA